MKRLQIEVNYLVQTVEGMSDRFNMDIRNLSEVVRIDHENKKVTIKNLRT